MHDPKNKPHAPKESGRDREADKPGDEFSGFLVMQLREGDHLTVGESVIVVTETRGTRVKLAVKARRSLLVRKMHGQPKS